MSEWMTADDARARLSADDVTDTEATVLRSVIALHHRVATLTAHRATAERERDDAVMAAEALAAERRVTLMDAALETHDATEAA